MNDFMYKYAGFSEPELHVTLNTVSIHSHGSSGKIFLINILSYNRRIFWHLKSIKLTPTGHVESLIVIFCESLLQCFQRLI